MTTTNNSPFENNASSKNSSEHLEMSGLESVAILALACNVMQVISFSHEAISTCRRLYDRSNDDGLSTMADNLDATSSSLRNYLRDLPQPTPGDEASLVELAQKSSGAAQRVRVEVEKCKIADRNKIGIKAVALTLKGVWNRRELEKAERDLVRCEEALGTGILVRLW